MATRLTKTQIESLKSMILSKEYNTSTEIGNLLGIPNYVVRQWAERLGLHFKKFTPFKAEFPITISEELNDIIIGSLLGDGCATKIVVGKNRRNKNSKISIKHCIKQEKYALMKERLLAKHCKTYINYREVNETREGWTNSQNVVVIETLQNSAFNQYREIWYPKGIKIIPPTLQSLSPLALAIWYQDDGYRIQGRGFYLSTNGFTLTDIDKLRDILYKQYGIVSSLHIDSRKQGKIFIREESVDKWEELITPFISEDMIYKFYYAHLKSDKLLENPEEDNQQPIINLNG